MRKVFHADDLDAVAAPPLARAQTRACALISAGARDRAVVFGVEVHRKHREAPHSVERRSVPRLMRVELRTER